MKANYHMTLYIIKTQFWNLRVIRKAQIMYIASLNNIWQFLLIELWGSYLSMLVFNLWRVYLFILWCTDIFHDVFPSTLCSYASQSTTDGWPSMNFISKENIPLKFIKKFWAIMIIYCITVVNTNKIYKEIWTW